MSSRRWAPLAALGLLLGCGDEVTIVSIAGGATGATRSTGGAGGAPPREIELAYTIRAHFSYEPDDLLVMVNHVDGSLVSSFRGGALPTKATVVDGDLVTFAYVGPGVDASGGLAGEINSYRVTAGVARIEEHVDLRGVPTCTVEKMEVTVHLPAVAGGLSAEVWGQSGGHDVTYELPADLTIDLQRCGDAPTRGVLTTVAGSTGYVAFQFDMIPFVAGTSIELAPTFAVQPRAPLRFDVDMLGDATQSDAHAQWQTDAEKGDILSAVEPDLDALFYGTDPFEYAPNLVDLPVGFPTGWVSVGAPGKGSACARGSQIFRVGASPSPISFHATELADPYVDGEGWALENGAKGDGIDREMKVGARSWHVFEDPVGQAYPAVFPAFPTELPPDFEIPTGTPVLQTLSHFDKDAVATYAELVASSILPEERTTRARMIYLQCDF